MKVCLTDFPVDRVDLLKQIVRNQGLGEGTLLLAPPNRWLAVMGLVCLGIGLTSAWALGHGSSDWPRRADAALPWVGLLGLVYAPLALTEYVRLSFAELKPFLLLTPLNLIRCRGSHRAIEIYRLSQASAFQRVEEYNGVKWAGQSYVFDFEAGNRIRFILRQRKDIEAAGDILALARAAGRGEPLPDLPILRAGAFGSSYSPPMSKSGSLEKLIDPASETWLVVLGFLCLGFIPYVIFR